MSALSITHAARDAANAIAIVLDDGTLTFDQLRRASRCAPSSRCIVGYPTVETIAAILRALDDETPLAIVHPKATADEQFRQRQVLGDARLPPDTAFVLFTSGSTGSPRGVVLTRNAILANAHASAAHLGWRDDDRWLLALPMAHAGGLSVVVRCLVARKPIVLAGESLAAALARSTLASLVPSQLATLLDDESWQPSPSLRAILLGGAGAPRALLDRAAARRVPFLRTYGLTEAFGQLATTQPERAGEPDAPLVALPGVTFVVEPAAGIDAPSDTMPATMPTPMPTMMSTTMPTTIPPTTTTATTTTTITTTMAASASPDETRTRWVAREQRIVARAPMLATQYLDGTPIAPELVTADLGIVDRTGHHTTLQVLGRADDVIISGGENVHPFEIEAALLATPHVRGALAFGIADVRWGQVVGAAIVVDTGFALDGATPVWSRLPAHQRPREIAIVETLPLLPNGKPDRRAAATLSRQLVRYR